jgi:hypothetical protein
MFLLSNGRKLGRAAGVEMEEGRGGGTQGNSVRYGGEGRWRGAAGEEDGGDPQRRKTKEGRSGGSRGTLAEGDGGPARLTRKAKEVTGGRRWRGGAPGVKGKRGGRLGETEGGGAARAKGKEANGPV